MDNLETKNIVEATMNTQKLAEAAWKVWKAAYDSGYTMTEAIPFLTMLQEKIKGYNYYATTERYSRYNPRYTEH